MAGWRETKTPLALIYFFPAPPSTIAMAVGFKGGSYGFIAERYKDDTCTRPREAGASQHCWWRRSILKLLQDRNSGVSAAFVQGGISNSKQAPGLLSLGRINYQIFCIFYRATDALNDLTELKGKRIAVGPIGNSRLGAVADKGSRNKRHHF